MHRLENICFCGLMRCICGHRSDSESPSPTPEEQRQQQQEQPAPQGTETGIELQDLPATPDPNRTRPADPADGETEPAPKRQKPNPKPEPAPAPVPASAPIPIPSAVPRPVPKESVVVETERDPVSDIEWLRQRGTQIVGWMDNPDLPDCPVQRSTLTLAQIQANQDAVFTRFGTPPDASFLDYESYADDPHNCVAWSIWFGMDLWVGMTARGVIVMANISRTWGSQHPFTSDIALALYAHQFGTTDSLRHIFFNGVVNTQTRGLISNYLYTNQFEPDVRDWEYGSQGYLALMGTRIGRVAAYTVLGAFPRGTHRISRVVTDFEPGALSVEMRFDIEAISGSG